MSVYFLIEAHHRHFLCLLSLASVLELRIDKEGQA
jgi:hypothetical protein